MQGNQYIHITHKNEGGEKSNLSPSLKDTPTEEGKLTTECDKVVRLKQDIQHLWITCQNEGGKKCNLNPRSKDDTMDSKDDGTICKREVVSLRPELWRKKMGENKKGDHNLKNLNYCCDWCNVGSYIL